MGSTCSISLSSELEGASRQIDAQLANLAAKIAKAEEDLRENVAKGASNPLARQRALQAIKKKNMLEEQRRQLMGAQFNLDSLTFQQDQARVTLAAVTALKRGTEQLKADQLKMDVSQVEALCDDAAVLADDMRTIGEALGQGYGEPDFEAEAALEAEYRRLGHGCALAAGPGPLAAASPLQPRPLRVDLRALPTRSRVIEH